MKLPCNFPSPIIAPVLIMLSATFVAVPAFNLVDPARISGPTGSTITRSTSVEAATPAAISPGAGDTPAATADACGLQVSKIVFAPNDFALPSAPSTNGVWPLAVIPITTSADVTPRSSKANARSEEHTSELQ